MGRSGGLGMTKTGKCLTDDNFFDQIQFLCPYNSIFNRKVFIFFLKFCLQNCENFLKTIVRKNIEIFVQQKIVPSLHYMVDLINK